LCQKGEYIVNKKAGFIGLFLLIFLFSLVPLGNAALGSPPVENLQIAAGGAHSLGLKSDGTLWAWGRNDYGQLGDGTTTERHSPVQVGTDTDWVSIAATEYHSLGLKSDGTLWAWGWNGFGQLGDGTTTERHSPVQVGTDTDWVSIAARGAHSLALKSDGTLWAWGLND